MFPEVLLIQLSVVQNIQVSDAHFLCDLDFLVNCEEVVIQVESLHGFTSLTEDLQNFIKLQILHTVHGIQLVHLLLRNLLFGCLVS